MLLIIGSRDDSHVHAVISSLREADAGFFVFDPSLGHQQTSISMSSSSNYGAISQRGVKIELADVTSVWYRSAERPTLESAGSKTRADFYKHEWVDAQRLAYRRLSTPDVRWINHPRAITRSSERIRAMSTAATFGFQIPEMLCSNRHGAVQHFAEAQSEVIAKPFQAIHLDGGLSSSVMAFTPAHLKFKESIELMPNIFQVRSRTQFQARLVCLGSDVFGAKIATADGDDVDVRNELGRRGYEPFEIPADLRSSCSQLMAHFELEYAALDVGLQHDGRWALFDINTMNNFLFMETLAPWLKTTERFAKHLVITKA